jgi:Flp pilus assembly protein CpaB
MKKPIVLVILLVLAALVAVSALLLQNTGKAPSLVLPAKEKGPGGLM